MDISELKTWLTEHILEDELNLDMIEQSNRKMRRPDMVSRRVIETQIMDYRNILRKIEDGEHDR